MTLKGRDVVWNSRCGNHLGQRSCASATKGRTYERKRSDQSTCQSCKEEAVHIWVVERSFAWATRFRRLVKDYERYAETLAGLHVVAFACLMMKQAVATAAGS